jgi:hypothetical protein
MPWDGQYVEDENCAAEVEVDGEEGEVEAGFVETQVST